MSSFRVHVALAIYASFAAIAWAWRHAQQASAWHDGAPLGTTHAIALPLGLSLGALTGVACLWASRVFAGRTRAGRELHDALRESLMSHTRDSWSVAALSLGAAFGEELLFRGAMLPTLRSWWGLAPAVLLSTAAFAMLHVPWNRRLIAWTFTAAAMGLVFAGLYVLTGEVLAPIAAHAVINHENLHFLLRPARRAATTSPR